MWWRRTLAVVALLFWVGIAHAQQSPCGSARPWVELVVTNENPAFRARVLADLSAGLSPTRIDTCERAPVERQRPLATVFVSPAKGSSSAFSIDVTDSVTQKRIGRDVDLRDVPEDGRTFALAVAAEELLRASWAELSVRRPAHPSQEPRSELSVSGPARASTPPDENHSALGLRFAVEHYTVGHTELGADVFWGQSLLPWLDVGLAVGARRGLAVEAADGSISASALHMETFGEFRLLSGGHYQLDASAGLAASRVWFVANADADAHAHDAEGYAVFANAGLVLALGAPGFLRSRTRVGFGVPLKSLAVSDDGVVVTGVSKLMVFASTGVVWEL